LKDLLEIRWHGRGGQGAKTAAQLLAETSMELGNYIQAFPEYGPERAGAPIRAFTRIGKDPINIHCAVTNPKIVVVIDPTLLESANVTDGVGNGIILVNTPNDPSKVRDILKFKAGKVGTVDATRIALDTLKIPMPNLPMLGALLKIEPIVAIEALEANIKDKFLKKIGEEKTNANIEGVKKAYEEVKVG